MAIIDDLWLAALTRSTDNAGSNNQFNLIINIDGADVFDQDFTLGWNPAAGRAGLAEGQTGLEESRPLSTAFDSNALTNSSIRLGIRGDDAWAPEHVLLICRTLSDFTPGRTLALAMETDLTQLLSSDSSEGHLTMRLRLVGAGSSTTIIRRVLFLVYTGSGSDVGTESSIQLQIAAGGAVVLDAKITDDLNKNIAHWYFLDPGAPFSRGDVVSNGSIRLGILGTDAWLPKSVFVFGLDTASGRPSEVVTLAAIPAWDLGWLSTDPQEGKAALDLPVSI